MEPERLDEEYRRFMRMAWNLEKSLNRAKYPPSGEKNFDNLPSSGLPGMMLKLNKLPTSHQGTQACDNWNLGLKRDIKKWLETNKFSMTLKENRGQARSNDACPQGVVKDKQESGFLKKD